MTGFQRNFDLKTATCRRLFSCSDCATAVPAWCRQWSAGARERNGTRRLHSLLKATNCLTKSWRNALLLQQWQNKRGAGSGRALTELGGLTMNADMDIWSVQSRHCDSRRILLKSAMGIA